MISRVPFSTENVLKNTKVISGDFDGPNPYLNRASKIGLEVRGEKIFRAVDFKISAPIYYIQGKFDDRTPTLWTNQHRKNVAQNETHLIFFHNAGHASLGIVSDFFFKTS